MRTQATSKRREFNYLEVLFLVSIALNFLAAFALRFWGNQMYPFFIIFYAWMTAYIATIALGLRLIRKTDRPLFKDWRGLFIIVSIAVSIRLVFFNLNAFISMDPLWYLDYGRLMVTGNIPYFDFVFPYPPVFAFFIWIISSISPSVNALKIFTIFLDIGIIFMLWKITSQKMDKKEVSISIIAYALLPIAVIESGWNAHFEPLVNLLLLLSLWTLMNRRHMASGVFLGLAAATKIYPLIVFPIFVYLIKNTKKRIQFTASVLLTGLATFVPVFFASWVSAGDGSVTVLSGNGVFDSFASLFGVLTRLHLPTQILSVGLFCGILIGLYWIIQLVRRNKPRSNERAYYSLSVALGFIFIFIGVIASLYPLLPVSRLTYWRFPADVGLVRGIASIVIGSLIVLNARRDLIRGLKRNVSKDAVLVLAGATSLLFIAMIRLYYYGWYLLWAIPIFLLVKDRRLGITVIICLLLVYPNYSSDNFATLGCGEPRQWQDDLSTVNNWSTKINIHGNFVNQSQVTSSINSDGDIMRLMFDTRNVTNESCLSNISISYTQAVLFDFNEATELIAHIAASWNPFFEREAYLSITFQGFSSNNQNISGTIISESGVFTNHSYISWRYSYAGLVPTTSKGTVTLLNVTVYPLQRVMASYYIDSIYTVDNTLLGPIYYITIPVISSLILIAAVILNSELKQMTYSTEEVEQAVEESSTKDFEPSET